MKFVLVIVFYPLVAIYGCFVEIRLLLYKIGLFKVSKTPIFSIGVGNITVGGTGKTPHVEYLIRKYKATHQLATLSRGYGRKTKGFLAVDSSMNAEKVGDEPWQFFMKFSQEVKVNVGEKRAPAAQKIHARYPKVDWLIMDDVFQHLAVKPNFSILLCDYTRPFFQDYPFPVGRLREFRKGAQRADTIIVSKCPADMSKEERTFFTHQLNRYAKGIPVAFSQFTYGEIIPVFDTVSTPSHWFLVTGIARPQPLIEYLQSQQCFLGHAQYPDHHDFSETESHDVVQAYKKLGDPAAGLLITEKDYARLSPMTKEVWKELPVFYIRIEVEFIEGEELLLQNIQRAADRNA